LGTFFWLFERKFLFFGGDLLLKRPLASVKRSAAIKLGAELRPKTKKEKKMQTSQRERADDASEGRSPCRFRRRSPPKKRNFLSKSQKKPAPKKKKPGKFSSTYRAIKKSKCIKTSTVGN
jgi:hypothetical protein